MTGVTALHVFTAYGVELEYMIVERETLSVLPIADRLLKQLQEEEPGQPGNFAWSNELVLHLLELKNLQPDARLDSLPAALQAEVQRVNRALEPMGAMLMPTGMHPWMNPQAETRVWPDDDGGIYSSYARIFDCNSHGWANLQSTQVNLPFADAREFARLHAAIRLMLPIIPALAASSPIAESRETGFIDYRMEVYRHHPLRVPSIIAQVIPDTMESCAQYRSEVLARMYRDIAPLDPAGALQHEWLNQRGAIARFDRNAIEIRVIDAQECPQADLAIAAATVASIRALYDAKWMPLSAQQQVATDTLVHIMLDCIRDGDRAVIADAGYLGLFGIDAQRCEARELWQHLIDTLMREQPEETERWREGLGILLEHGPLARRILRAVGNDFSRERLQAVYRELCDCLHQGHMFLPVV